MIWIPNARRLRLAALAAAATLAGCQQERASLASVEPVPELRIAVEASSLDATPGSRITVAVRGETQTLAPLGVMQGRLRFNPAALRYVGQSLTGPAAVTNDMRADEGELHFVNADAFAIPARSAEYVFEVVRADWADRLGFTFEVAALEDGTPIRAANVLRGVSQGQDLLVPQDARRLASTEWDAVLYPELVRQRPAQVPGQYVLNLKYGDVNLNGSIEGLDAQDVKRITVGINPIIVGTDAPARDRVVAANVVPANLPGLGEITDANPPGREADGSRRIDGLDAQRVTRAAVGIAQPAEVVGMLIPGRGPVAIPRVQIATDVVASRTLFKDTIYELAGRIRVRNGATLTIQEGTRIEGLTGPPGSDISALLIDRDGWLVAIGTALEPIRFTCTAVVKAPGCWGGLLIAGNGLLNDGTLSSPAIAGRTAGGCAEKLIEGTTDVFYGGCTATDSSGVLRYAVIEYGGFLIATNNELNGLTIGGGGSGTDIEFVQVHAGLDDGIELFGGQVNVRNLLLTANQDDAFDISFGWSGSAQFVIVQQDSLNAEKGVEADNTEASATYEATPVVSGQMWNFTFVGEQATTSTSGALGNNVNDALHLRRGTAPQIRNAIVYHFNVGLDLDDAATCTAPEPEVANSIFVVGSLGNSDGSDPVCSGAATETAFLQLAAKANQTAALGTALMVSPFNVIVPDFRPVATAPAGLSYVGAVPPANGFLDPTATFIGAVPPASASGNNIPWYSGWTRGWQNATTP